MPRVKVRELHTKDAILAVTPTGVILTKDEIIGLMQDGRIIPVSPRSGEPKDADQLVRCVGKYLVELCASGDMIRVEKGRYKRLSMRSTDPQVFQPAQTRRRRDKTLTVPAKLRRTRRQPSQKPTLTAHVATLLSGMPTVATRSLSLEDRQDIEELSIKLVQQQYRDEAISVIKASYIKAHLTLDRATKTAIIASVYEDLLNGKLDISIVATKDEPVAPSTIAAMADQPSDGPQEAAEPSVQSVHVNGRRTNPLV